MGAKIHLFYRNRKKVVGVCKRKEKVEKMQITNRGELGKKGVENRSGCH